MYRRRIALEAEPGIVRGRLEDDFHRFEVELTHDAAHVVGVTGGAVRFPWTTCPGAVSPLAQLDGMPLSRSLRTIAKHVDPRAQCTHLFDLACLAVTLAARGGRAIAYEIAIPDRTGLRTHATLSRDGSSLLAWELDGMRIESPLPYAGRSLAGGGFAEWTETDLDPDAAEAAQVLRRAAVISWGRRYDFDRISNARVFQTQAGGACFTFTEERVDQGGRVLGSVRDLTRGWS